MKAAAEASASVQLGSASTANDRGDSGGGGGGGSEGSQAPARELLPSSAQPARSRSSPRPASAPRLRPVQSDFSTATTPHRRSYTSDDINPTPLRSVREPGNTGLSSVDAIRARLRLRSIGSGYVESTQPQSPAVDALKQRLADVEKQAIGTAFSPSEGASKRPQHNNKENVDLASLNNTTSQALSSLRERLARIRTGNIGAGGSNTDNTAM